MPYHVLARKYRPKQFSEVVGQDHVVRALSNALMNDRMHHAYLFTGTRGCGKTTVARILAKCLSCETGITPEPCNQCEICKEIDQGCFPDFFEVDAASRTKVEDTRELLDNIPYAATKGRFKIYLIDEVHMLSGHSFNALLKTLEEPPSHVKFLLATTDHQKLPATILSRCLQFHLQNTMPKQIAEHLATILTQEKLSFEAPALLLLGNAAHGSLRDALSLLDQAIAFGNGRVLEVDVRTWLGTVENSVLLEILQALHAKDASLLLSNLQKLELQGAHFSQALTELLALLHKISVLQLVPEAEVEHSSAAALQALAKTMRAEDVQLFYQIGILGQRDFAFSPSPSIAFEMTLLRMLAFYPGAPKEIVAPSTTKTTSPQAITTPQSTTWQDTITHLSLTGAALSLVQNCSLLELSETKATLLIKPSQKALAQPNQIQRIQQALTAYLQKPIQVEIRVEPHEQSTPADLGKQQQQERHQTAKETLIKDEKLQQLMQTFDATLVENSITTENKGESDHV